MPYDYDNKIYERWPVGVAKADVDVVGDEVIIKVDKDQMALLEKQLKMMEMPEGLDQNIFKKTADSFMAFSAAEKMVNPCKEEPVDNNWAHVRSAEMLVHYPRNSKQGEMYDDNTVNPGWLNFHNVKDLLARFFVTVHANHGKVRNWRELCIGITSMDHEGGQMPMFDYDGKNIKTRVKKDIKQLQNKFGLGDATVYETRRGLHVYFFSDFVERDQYAEMLNSVNCCKGFKSSFERNGYAVLRVSAKYTEFDILPYKVIISPNRGAGRPGRKAALIQELLRLGQECGTHFASLYPQWGQYQEDMTSWRVGGKKRSTRRVKKVSHAEYKAKQALMARKKSEKEVMYKMSFNNAIGETWANTTTTTTSNQFVAYPGTYK